MALHWAKPFARPMLDTLILPSHPTHHNPNTKKTTNHAARHDDHGQQLSSPR